ncbi:ribonuclease H-like domain-containing protein [Infundibulicybe gibba]|nr:ribonuclease H-like domain-containing protein [Infundibulicybe gibba]
MFSSLGLFQTFPCPQRDTCTRPKCIFSHRSDLPPPPPLAIPVQAPKTASIPSEKPPHQSASSSVPSTSVPAKRAVPMNSTRVIGASTGEPPKKLQKLGPSRTLAVSTVSHTSSGVPLLKVNAAHSQVAIPVRQAMVKTLYDHFVVLYDTILPANPTLASEHALRQEEEVYKKSSKLTYRNAIIQCAAALKRRSIPDSASHASVGTEEEVAARVAKQKSLERLRLTKSMLEPTLMPMDALKKWGYFTEIPEGPGGDQPSLEGKVAKCERCTQPFLVKKMEDADKCIYHWGKPISAKVNGERTRVYTCCSRPVADGEGCSHGPHVFYESKIEDLHARHPFSFLQPASPGHSALDVAAMDCEMIYSTGGQRVARVSIVDGSGTEVFDELVKMDDGVEVIDFITRFSGITADIYSKALLPLASIRKSLDNLINADTILIGHALDNDLKTLRIIHHKCVDTAILFPHHAGPPYRKALKNLVREMLGTLIQTAGSAGHSSVEDAIATLNLVRWYILNNKPKLAPPATS